MLIKQARDIAPSEITAETVYRERRRFLTGTAALAALAAMPAQAALPSYKKNAYGGGESANSWDEITSYNNLYEFGTDKADPAKYAHTLKPRPWTLAIEGACRKPRSWDIDALTRTFPLEERIYRLRCVEGWCVRRFCILGRRHRCCSYCSGPWGR